MTGDIAWIMFDNRPCKVVVKAIIIEIYPRNTYIKYNIESPDNGWDTYSEKEIFPTKDELLDSLR